MAAEVSAKAFLDRLVNDASFRAQFRTVGATTIASIMDFATMKGFSFTADELRAALKDAPDNLAVNQIADILKIPRKPSVPTA